MTIASVTFSGAGVGFIIPAHDGGTVSAIVPAGCVLRRSPDAQSWSDVADAVPFTHSGAMAHYRIDCINFLGQVTATLEIV